MSDLRGKRVLAKQARRKKTRFRVRRRVVGTAERPRLAVYKSLRYIYAQVIDDRTGTTLVSASSQEQAIGAELAGGRANKSAARKVGEKVAERAKEKGLSRVVFDRGGHIYHGKIKEVADGARAGGLEL